MDQRMPKRRFGLLLTADRGYLNVNMSIFFDSRGAGFAYWLRVLCCCTPFLIPTLVLRIGMCVLFVLRQVVFVNIFSAFAILGSFPAATFDFSLFFRFTSQAFPPSRFWLARIAGVLLRVGAKSD